MSVTTDGFEDFLSWHTLRVQRRSGKPPAHSTLVSKHSRLRSASDALHTSGYRCTEQHSTGRVGSAAQTLGTALGDRAAVEGLLDVLATQLSPGAMRNNLDALQDFGAYAVAKGWAGQVALLPTDRPKPGPQKPITVYTQAELHLLLSTARGRGLRFWMFLETLAHTGRRVGEVLGLEWAQLQLGADVPHFNLPTTKNGKQQYVPLNRHLVDDVFTPANVAALKTEPSRSHRAFARDIATCAFPWSYAAAWKMFTRHCRTVGVESRSFHCFRHTKATELLAKGVPLQAVSSLLGHSDVSTTFNRYHHATTLNYASYLD
jgi:integrase